MRHSEVLFKEAVNRVKAQLKDIKEIDVVIGIPFYNEGDTLKNIISVAKSSLKAKCRKLIVCVGDTAGKEAIKIIKENFGEDIISFLMPTGVNGRGHSIRAILELASFFQSDVVLLEADLKSQGDQGIKPDWVDRIANPVFRDYELAVGCFRRDPFEDIISNILVIPLITALYETKFNDPLSGVVAISHDLVEEFCSEFDQYSEYIGGYGINPWIITTALKSDKKICEVSLGAKLSPVTFGKKHIAIKEMLRALLQCIKRDEDSWLDESHIIKTVDMYDSEYDDTPLKVAYNYKEFLDSFIEGICHYNNLLQKVYNQEMLSHIESMAKPNLSPSFLPDIWARITYETILACNFNSEILPEDLFEVFMAVYYGITASLIKEMRETKKRFKDADIDTDAVISAQVEGIYKNTVRAFIKNKSNILRRSTVNQIYCP